MYSKLSKIQRQILKKEGKYVVRACPGSGKTYCVAAKVSKLLDSWNSSHQGIAILSFTNTAWQEIEQKCNNEFNKRLNYPHFLGTIDKFINQYIFLPFGHLEMKCSKRPELVGEPHQLWSGGRYKRDYKKHFDKCSFDINDNLISTTTDPSLFGFTWKNKKDGTKNKNILNLEYEKKLLNAKGYATQSDANYYAMKILENPDFGIILKSLSQKFTWLIIDEAQDTSDIQMRIIDLLIESGIKNVMIVGDPDQAIFEWNNAKPELFETKYEKWKSNSITLLESYRSSKLICDVIYKLSSQTKQPIIPAENNDVKDSSITPEIWVYDDVNETIKSFIEKCVEYNIPQKNKKGEYNRVILSRSKSFFTGNKTQTKVIDIWSDTDTFFTREFMKGKYYYDNKKQTEGLKLIERAVTKVLLKKVNGIKQVEVDDFIRNNGGITKFRQSLHLLVNRMPDTDMSLGNWILEANKTVPNSKLKLSFSIKEEATNLLFNQVFKIETDSIQNEDYKCSTIHQVKGETYEAVLVFLKDKAGNSAKYSNILQALDGKLTNENIDKYKEEGRIIYVSLSRPRQLLVVAVPSNTSKKLWQDRLGL